jgi:Protein of unknown function (DUF3987)
LERPFEEQGVKENTMTEEHFRPVEGEQVEARERLAQKRAKQSLHDWDAPDWSILDDRRGDLPDFPLDCFPAPVRAWVRRAADGAGVTVAHVAVPALGIASSLIGMARSVKASRSWIAPMTCWTAVVGASGTGKTPGIDTIKRALAQVDRDSQSKIVDLQRKHEEKAGVAKAARAQWEKEVKEALAEKKAAPSMPSAAMEIGKFVAPQLYVSNATVERLGELLQARPHGMLQLMDELAALFMNMSRYSGGEDNQFWLEAWNGSPYNVQRMGRPPLHIPHLLIGVVGGVQPDKLAASFEGDHDGMYARFLFAWPQEPAYQTLTDDAEEVDTDIVNVITRLGRLAEFEDGKLVKRSIELSAEARAGFEQFRQFVHREKEALDGREREWMAKATAHVLRLSGTLCLLGWASGLSPTPPTEIASEYMVAAIRLVRDYFWLHARAALRQIGLSDRHVNARRALRWIRAHRQTEVSLKDIRRDALGQKLDAEETGNLLSTMERSGWVRKKEVKTEGRSAWRWEVNAKLYYPYAESAESAGSHHSSAYNDGDPDLSALPALPAAGSINGGDASTDDAGQRQRDGFEHSEPTATAPSDVPTGHICAQCNRVPPDGKEEPFPVGRDLVWLHPECRRFYQPPSKPDHDRGGGPDVPRPTPPPPPSARTNGVQHQAATDAVADAPSQAEPRLPASTLTPSWNPPWDTEAARAAAEAYVPPAAPADTEPPPPWVPYSQRDIDHQRHGHEGLMDHVNGVIEEQLRNLDEAWKANREAAAEEKQPVEPPAQPVSAPAPVPAAEVNGFPLRPPGMPDGDWKRLKQRARDLERLRQTDPVAKRLPH